MSWAAVLEYGGLLRAPRLVWSIVLSAKGPSWPKSLQSLKTSINGEEIKSLEVSYGG